MHPRGRPRSNSAIELDELDEQSHYRVNRSSTSSGSHGPSSQDQDQGQDREFDDDEYEHENEHEHVPSEPRGAGTAGTAGSESGARSKTPPPPWRKRPISRVASAWGSHVSCEVDFAAARDHLGTRFPLHLISAIFHMLPHLSYFVGSAVIIFPPSGNPDQNRRTFLLTHLHTSLLWLPNHLPHVLIASFICPRYGIRNLYLRVAPCICGMSSM